MGSHGGSRAAGSGGGGGISSDLIARANNRSFLGNMGDAVNRTYQDNVQALTTLANTKTKQGRIASSSELADSIAEMKTITENVLSSNMNLQQARKTINDYFRDTRKKWNDRIVDKNTRRGSGDSTTY